MPTTPRKLRPPSVPEPVIIRKDLIEFISSSTANVVLLRAPAGFGKSVLMRQLYDSHIQKGQRVGWLDLEPEDNDATQLLTHLSNCITTLKGQALTQAVDARIPELLDIEDHLEQIEEGFAVFIDGMEAMTSEVVIELFAQLLNRLPPNGRIYVSSRQPLKIQFARLKLSGYLIEVNSYQLRFSTAEVRQVLNQTHRTPVSSGLVAKIECRTQGWPAGVWLLAKAPSDELVCPDYKAAISAHALSVEDYLSQEVLARQPKAIQTFMLESSVLQQLTAQSCDFLLDRSDSATLLAQIFQAGFFLQPLASDSETYEFNPLLHDFLRNQLRQNDLAGWFRLHRRATQWFERIGDFSRSLEYAWRSTSRELQIELLDRHWERLLWAGKALLLSRWYDHLKIGGLSDMNEGLLLGLAWALVLAHRHPEGTQLLLEVQSNALSDENRAMALSGNAFSLAMSDQIPQAIDQWQRFADSQLHHPFADAMHSASYGYLLLAKNQPAHAARFVELAAQQSSKTTNSFIQPMAQCLHGAVALTQGRLKVARQLFQDAAADLRIHSQTRSTYRTTASVFLAEVLYELGEYSEAERLLLNNLSFLKSTGAPDQLITAFTVLSRVAQVSENWAEADNWLTEMEFYGRKASFPRLVATALLERSRIALYSDKHDLARDFLSRSGEMEVWQQLRDIQMPSNDLEDVTLAELRLAVYSTSQINIADRLHTELALARGTLRLRRALKLTLLQAIHAFSGDDKSLATRYLTDALNWCRTDGFLRLVLDEGPLIVEIFKEWLKSQRSDNVRFDPYLVLIAQHARVELEPSLAKSPIPVVEGLSKRELDVLRLLASGERNRVIAARLFVSETTVKAHLRSIHQKLGAMTRTEAVAIARRHGLLP